MIAGGLWVFITDAAQGRIRVDSVIVGVFCIWFIWVMIQRRQETTKAARSERLNRAVLERLGATDNHCDSSTEVRAPKVALAGAVVVMFFAFAVPYGTLQALGDEASLNVTDVLGRGAFFGVVMTIFQLFWERHRARQTKPNHSTDH